MRLDLEFTVQNVPGVTVWRVLSNKTMPIKNSLLTILKITACIKNRAHAYCIYIIFVYNFNEILDVLLAMAPAPAILPHPVVV